MKNLFIGGSSELALSVAKKLKNVDNISRSKNRIYKKNKIISNYSNNELKKNIKSLEENYSNILIFNGLYQRSLLTNFNTNKFLFLGGVPDRLNRIGLLYELYN